MATTKNAGYNQQPNVSTIVKTPNDIRDHDYTTELELQLAEMHTQFNRVVTIQKEMQSRIQKIFN